MTPSESQGFRGVSLKKGLVGEVESFIKEFPGYRSIPEFLSEAARLRMETLRKGRNAKA